MGWLDDVEHQAKQMVRPDTLRLVGLVRVLGEVLALPFPRGSYDLWRESGDDEAAKTLDEYDAARRGALAHYREVLSAPDLPERKDAK